MTNNKIKLTHLKAIFLIGVWVACVNGGFAQQSPNNFFGTMPGTTGPNQSYDDPPGTPGSTAPTKLPAAGGDFTADEKRMQRKYKANMAHDQAKIKQGERMMKSGNVDSKEYKKGKIIKEIAEKNLAEMKANSPFPDKPDNKKKSK